MRLLLRDKLRGGRGILKLLEYQYSVLLSYLQRLSSLLLWLIVVIFPTWLSFVGCLMFLFCNKIFVLFITILCFNSLGRSYSHDFAE